MSILKILCIYESVIISIISYYKTKIYDVIAIALNNLNKVVYNNEVSDNKKEGVNNLKNYLLFIL